MAGVPRRLHYTLPSRPPQYRRALSFPFDLSIQLFSMAILTIHDAVRAAAATVARGGDPDAVEAVREAVGAMEAAALKAAIPGSILELAAGGYAYTPVR